MTEQEKFKKTFEKLRASKETINEVLNMTERDKVVYIKKKKAIRMASMVAIMMLVLVSTASIAYAKDLGGIQRKVDIWIHGDCTNAVLTEDNGTFLLEYFDNNKESVQLGGGGIVADQNGNTRAMTSEEFLDEINNCPDVIYEEDGSVWIYYKAQRWEITDKFKDGFCYITLDLDDEKQYITVSYKNGYGVSPYNYSKQEDFQK